MSAIPTVNSKFFFDEVMISLFNKFVLVLLLLFTGGCLLFDEVQNVERVLIDNRELPALESADILQASLRYHPQIPQIASRLEREAGIDRDIWSIPVQRALNSNHAQQYQLQTVAPGSDRQPANTFGRTSVPAENEVLITEHLNRITSQAKRVEWNGRIFYFLSVAVDTQGSEHSGGQFESNNGEEPTRSHRVYALDEQGRGVTYFETQEVDLVFEADGNPRRLPSQPLQFNVVVTEKGPTVIYRDRDGIYARSLTFDDRRKTSSALSGTRYFAFGEKQLIAKAEVPYGRFQLISRLDREGTIHSVWTEGWDKHDLWYCHYRPVNGEICDKPDRIAQTASSEPVNLMIQNDKIYISWIDNRYTQGFWSPKNFAKLLLIKSDDGGESFNSPISVNPPRDEADNAVYSVTLLGPGERILVFWGTEAMGTGTKNQDLFYGWLDSDLDTLYIGKNKFPGDRLHKLMQQKIIEYQQGLGNI